MPADPDLDALDELYRAATPGRLSFQSERDHASCDLSRRLLIELEDGRVEVAAEVLATNDELAAFIAALVNAWPEIRRRLAIGNAARKVLEAEEQAIAVARAAPRAASRNEANRAVFVAEADYNAARAKLRALMEDGDA